MSKENKEPIKKEENKEKNTSALKDKIGFGIGYVFLAIAVVVVFVIVNLIAGNLSLTYDFTENKLYSVSEATKDVLNELDEDVEIIALYDKTQGMATDYIADVIRLLDVYDEYEHIEVSYVSLNDNPNIVNEKVGNATVSAYSEGDYIIKSDKRTRRVAFGDMFQYGVNANTGVTEILENSAEKSFTTAIQYVVKEKIPKIYFSNGFSENNMSLYESVLDDLYKMLYVNTDTINLQNVEKIPEDADVIVFLGPKTDLTAKSYEILREWLEFESGTAFFAFDSDSTGTEFKRFNTLLSEVFGLKINNDIVSDSEDYQIVSAGSRYVISAETLENGPFADGMTNPISNIYKSFESRSITIEETVGYFNAKPMIQTSSTGVSLEYTTDGTGSKEKTGRHILAACSEGIQKGYEEASRVVVLGSSKGLMDEYIDEYEDASSVWTFLCSINWMAGESEMEEVEGVLSRSDTTDKVIVDVTQSRWLFVFIVVIYPLIIIGIGVFVWVKRRHL